MVIKPIRNNKLVVRASFLMVVARKGCGGVSPTGGELLVAALTERSGMFDVIQMGGGILVVSFYVLLVALAGGYAVHRFFLRMERLGYRRRAKSQGDGYYLNGEYYSPEELVDRASRINDELAERIRRNSAEEAFHYFKSGGRARIQRESEQ